MKNHDHSVRVSFSDPAASQARNFTGVVDRIVFGSAEYQWHPDPAPAADEARAFVQAAGDGEEGDASAGRAREYGHGDPDGPASHSTVTADGPDTLYNLPKASIIVLRGSLKSR